MSLLAARGYNRGMNTLCLVVDRLHWGYLGPWGNTWIDTPSFNRLASQGFVLDQFHLDSPQLDRLYQSYWLGRHARRSPISDVAAGLPGRLAAAGIETVLVTDEPLVVRDPLATPFSRTVELEGADPRRLAVTIDQTHLAHCFAVLLDQLEAGGPSLTWCHLQSLGAAWDGPAEFRGLYVEPGDPEPSTRAEVPSLRLDKDFDPDQLLAISQAYAGQVTLLDACLGGLMEALESSPTGRETLLVVLSSRGFPLGEHGSVGTINEQLYGELVHLPLVLRFPDALGEGGRSQALVQPADVCATLLDWHGLAVDPASDGKSLLPLVREEVSALADRLHLVGSGQRALRTPAWYLRQEGERAELFAKPDDVWEANEVSARAAPVVELLLTAMDQEPPQPLDEVLVTGME